MKVVLTCGHSHSGYQLAHKVLISAGLVQAKLQERPESSSMEDLRETWQSLLSGRFYRYPDELCNETLLVSEPATTELGTLEQLFASRVLHETAVDLFATNVYPKDWGWFDASAVSQLEFWKTFDPQIRFALVYSAPEFAVGQMLHQKNATPGNIDSAIASWIAANTQLLTFYNRNSDRCVLVNTSAVIHAPSRFIDVAASNLGLDICRPAIGDQIDRTAIPAIASSLARALIEDSGEAMALYYELESTADLDAATVCAREAEKRQASQEYVDLLSNLELVAHKAQEQATKLTELQERLDARSAEVVRLMQSEMALAETRKRVEEQEAMVREAQRVSDALQSEVEQLRVQGKTVGEENELLLREVYQIHEEIEHYLLQRQQLALKAQSRISFECQPAEITFDLRREFNGDNWYYAEDDGRWAGPGKVSSIKLPALPLGRYEMQLNIVDAMEPEILTAMEVLLNGTKIDMSVDWQGYPAIVQGQFSSKEIEERPTWDFQLKFPKVVSPAQHGSDDQRYLAIRVHSLKLCVAP